MAGNWSQLSYFTLSYSALSAPLVSKMKILSFMQSSVVLFHGSSQRYFFFFPSPLHPSPQLLMFCLQQQHLNGLNAVPLLEQRHFRVSAVQEERSVGTPRHGAVADITPCFSAACEDTWPAGTSAQGSVWLHRRSGPSGLSYAALPQTCPKCASNLPKACFKPSSGARLRARR